jgi:hypothetical protein
MVPERLHRVERLVGRSAIQFVMGFREVRHESSLRGKRCNDVKEQGAATERVDA